MLQYKNRIITGVTHDSRNVMPGDVFVAIKGLTSDGHEYIQEAVAKGASLVVSEKELEQKVPYIKVNNSRTALALLARNFYNRPDKQLFTLGVTGTNGKTTITSLISHILNDNKIASGIIGTNGVSFSGNHWESILTTPDAVSLYKYLHQMVEGNVKAVAMEVSSHSLKQQRVEGMLFNIAVFTNLSLDHLDLHGTYQDYLETKLTLGNKLKPDGYIIYNKDDILAKSVREKLKAPKISYSLIDSSADVRGYLNKTSQHGTEMEVKVNSNYFPFIGTFRLTTKLVGEHNAGNTLAAVCCCLAMGLSPGEIAGSVAKFAGVKRRLEVIYRNDFTVIDDFCHNPANYDAVLRAADLFPKNQVHLVTLVRGSRGELVNTENAKVISYWGKQPGKKKIYVTNCEDTVQPKDKVNRQEETAFLKPLWHAGLSVNHSATLTQTLEEVLDQVEEDDVILLLGSHPFKYAGEQLITMINNKKKAMPYAKPDLVRQEKQWLGEKS